MANKKKAPVPPPTDKRARRVDLLPEDVLRLSKLAGHFRREWGRSKVSEVEVMRAGWRQACIALGLELTVEPIGGA